MLSRTRKSILEIDAFLSNSINGYIIVDNNKAYLQTDDKLIQLTDQHEIKILNNRKYLNVSYQDLIDTHCTMGAPLYAGKIALVK